MDLTAKQLADDLQISHGQVMARCRARQWPHYRVGKSPRFTPEDVAAIKAQSRVEPVATPANPWGVRRRRRASA